MRTVGMILVFLFSTFSIRATDELSQNLQAVISADNGEGIDFSSLFGNTIKDGFFGGVKWGIAMAFYQVLYSMMGLTIFTVPKVASHLLRKYTQWRDARLGKAPLLEIYELRVLVDLLLESLKEYEQIDVHLLDDNTCALLPVHALSTVMKHIHEYVILRLQRYKDSVYEQEVLFFLQFIAHTIEKILGCVECATYHTEVVSTAKTAIIIMNKLIQLLEGAAHEGEQYNFADTSFSKKGTLYIFH